MASTLLLYNISIEKEIKKGIRVYFRMQGWYICGLVSYSVKFFEESIVNLEGIYRYKITMSNFM